MALLDDINRLLRDHEGYTGDGQGGTGALPVGDRSTARRQIWTRDLRDLLRTIAQSMGDPSALQDILDQLDDKADNSDVAALSHRNVATIWVANFASVTFPPGTDTVLQRQNTSGGYVRFWMIITAPETPDPAIQQQDETGQWWELFYDSTLVEFRGTRVYRGRDDAFTLIGSNPPSSQIHRVLSIEDGYMVVRGRNSQIDALFAENPYWGIEQSIRLSGAPDNPLVNGRPNVGEFLDLDLGLFDPALYDINWQWSEAEEGTQGWSVILGEISPSYRVGEDYEGRFLRARVRPAGLGVWVVSNVIGPIGERLAGALPDNVSAALSGEGSSRTHLPRFDASIAEAHDLRDGVGAAPPLDLYQDYSLSVGTEWLGAVTAPLPVSAANLLTTYDPSENVIHPCMIEFFNDFCGYRYICAITAYPNGPAFEDPFIYGSNDRKNWIFLGSAPQPLATKAAISGSYNSDTFLTHDPRTGELIVGWRSYEPRSEGDSTEENSDVVIRCRTSRNGYAWSEVRQIMTIPADQQIMLAPTVIYDPKSATWHMWVINRPVMNHWTAPSIYGPWALAASTTDLSMFDTPHHHEIKWVGDKLVCLMYSRGDGNLFFGVFAEDSWIDVTWSMAGVLDPRPASLYKASFIPVIDSETGTVAFDIWWTNGATGPAGGTEMGHGRKLQYAQTIAVPVTVALLPASALTITVYTDPGAFESALPGPNELAVLTDA